MASIDALVCRRSPHLVCYWRGGDYIIENFATGVRVVAPALTANILGCFDDWRLVRDVLAASPVTTHDTLRTLLHTLVRHSLLQRRDRAPSPREQAMDAWQPWNPAAGFFHTTTKDMAFFDMDKQVKHLRAKSRTVAMPDPIKRYRDAVTVPLPVSADGGEFPRVLRERRTWRQFSRKNVDLQGFGTLLGLTAGVQRWANVRGEGKVALKTSPSGGARHAIELYTLALRIDGLPRGLYHYAADDHALELINHRVSARLVERYLPNQPWYLPAAAVVFLAAVFPREIWRYTYARAYRAVLIEAGHLCQTFCLTATWLGLAPFCTMALADSRIEQDLGLDGITESVLYAAGVGARPRGVATTPPRSVAGKPAMLTRREVRSFPGRIAVRSAASRR